METRGIREGMTVRSSDGRKLGKVIRCGADEFIIEKGFFFPKDYVARYDQASVSGDEVTLSLPASSLREVGGADDVRARVESAGGMGTHLGTYAGGESDLGGGGRVVGESEDVRREERRAEGDVRREGVKVDEEGEVEERGDVGSVHEPEE